MKKLAAFLLVLCSALIANAQGTTPAETNEKRVPLSEAAVAMDGTGAAALEATLRTTSLNGSPEAPITNVRIVVKNVSAIPYAFVSGLLTFYDAAGVRCGEGVFKADALATNESFETDAPGLRIRCEPASWRLVAINLLPRVAPNTLVAPLTRENTNLEIVIDGESHPIQLDKPLVLTLGERRRTVIVRAAP
ncbi:MAG TPA: hypothetical protein VGK82_05190 [Pyrinomonadaceae bacterium]